MCKADKRLIYSICQTKGIALYIANKNYPQTPTNNIRKGTTSKWMNSSYVSFYLPALLNYFFKLTVEGALVRDGELLNLSD